MHLFKFSSLLSNEFSIDVTYNNQSFCYIHTYFIDCIIIIIIIIVHTFEISCAED
jgi:hypothetical protein